MTPRLLHAVARLQQTLDGIVYRCDHANPYVCILLTAGTAVSTIYWMYRDTLSQMVRGLRYEYVNMDDDLGTSWFDLLLYVGESPESADEYALIRIYISRCFCSRTSRQTYKIRTSLIELSSKEELSPRVALRSRRTT